MSVTPEQMVRRLRATRNVIRHKPHGVMTDVVILEEAAQMIAELSAAYGLACAQRDKLKGMLVDELASEHHD